MLLVQLFSGGDRACSRGSSSASPFRSPAKTRPRRKDQPCPLLRQGRRHLDRLVGQHLQTILALKFVPTRTGHQGRLRRLIIGGAGGAAQDVQVSLKLDRTSNTTDGTSTSGRRRRSCSTTRSRSPRT
jgi:hypothetical protein